MYISKYGLKYIPSLGSEKADNRDSSINTNVKVKSDYTLRDREILKNVLLSLKKCNTILEIGVARGAYNNTSTSVLLNNKNDSCFYFGIDINDKKVLTRLGIKNVYTMRTDSSKIGSIMYYIDTISGDKEIDLLHIDGLHSINQVLKDWRFVEYIRKDGAIVLHDTNVHPGPSELVKAIDINKFEVKQHFKDRIDDWGITVVRKKT